MENNKIKTLFSNNMYSDLLFEVHLQNNLYLQETR